MDFVSKHNVVAWLDESVQQAAFSEIISFIKRSSVHVAMSASPIIYCEWIKEFWNTAGLHGNAVRATIKGKVVEITQADFKKYLQLNDDDNATIEFSKTRLDKFLDRLKFKMPPKVKRLKTIRNCYVIGQWRYLMHCIASCMSGRKAGKDALTYKELSLMMALTFNLPYNTSRLLFMNLREQAEAKANPTRFNDFYQYPRFLQIILQGKYPDLPKVGKVMSSFSMTTRVFSAMNNDKVKEDEYKPTPMPLLGYLIDPNFRQQRLSKQQKQHQTQQQAPPTHASVDQSSQSASEITARRRKGKEIAIDQGSGLNMCKTNERACSNTNTVKKTDDKITILQKDLQPITVGTIQDPDSDDDDDQVGHNTGKTMGKTRQRAWEKTDTPKKKLKQTQNLLDDDEEMLDPKQEQRELVENVSPVSDSVEKILSPQSEIVCVHGYQVKRSNATILEAIFKKHGDIAAECILKTDYVLSSILEAVCEVVRQIQTDSVVEKLNELECRLSDAEATNINVTWLRAHLEAIAKWKDSSKKYTSLMGMKQNASLVKIGAQKDLRERCDELVVAQQRFTTAERCVRVLNLVEKNLNDQIFESKSELDSYVNHPVV